MNNYTVIERLKIFLFSLIGALIGALVGLIFAIVIFFWSFGISLHKREYFDNQFLVGAIISVLFFISFTVYGMAKGFKLIKKDLNRRIK